MPQLIRAVVVFIVVATSSVALADDYDTAYDAGTAAFNSKDYPKARAEFEKALAIRPDPINLFNIAQTYRLENNVPKAIEYYKRYLADPNTPANVRAKAQEYLDELERQKPAPVPTPTPTPTPMPTPTPTPTPQPQVDTVRKRTIPLGSKIAAGVTGAGLIASLIFTKRGLDKENDFQKARDAGTATPDDAKSVDSAQNLINISWGFTAAAAITSVVIYFAAPSYSTDSKNVVIAPNRDGGFTAAFTTRF